MPDTINVKITADASGFTSGTNQAKTALDQLAAAAQAQNSTLQQIAATLQQNTAAHGAHSSAVHQSAAAHTALGSQIEEANEKLKSMLSPITSVTDGLKEMGEIIIAAFAVEKIKEFVESMAKLGETTLKFSSITGASVEQFSGFAAMLRIVGVDAEAAGRTLERLQRNMSQALAQPTGRAGEGFTALGIGLQDISSRMDNAVSMIDLLREKYNEFADGADKTAAFIAIMGRAFDQLVPLLRKNKEEIEEYKRSLADIGAKIDVQGNVSIISTDQAHAMEETGEKANFLSLALQGVAIAVYDQLKPAIDGTIDALTQLAVAFRQDVEAGGPFSALVNVLGEAIQVLNTWLTGATISLRLFGAAGRDVFNDFAGGAKAIGQALTGDFSGAWKTWSETAKNRTAEVDKEFQKLLDDIAKATAAQNIQRNYVKGQGQGTEKVGPLSEGGGGGKQTRVTQWRAELDEQLERERDFFKESSDTELAFWRDKIAKNQEGWKQLSDARAVYVREYQQWHKNYYGKDVAPEDVPYSETPEQRKAGIRGADEKRAADEQREVRKQVFELEKTQARQALAEKMRLIEAEKSAELKANDEALQNAKNNEAERMRLLQDRIRIIDEAYEKERRANADAGRVLTPAESQTQQTKQAGEDSEARKRITAEQQKDAEERARDQIKLLEIARKGADQQEQLQLHVLERRVSLGELTVDAAASAEAQIVQATATRVAQILALEAQQAQGKKELLEEVRDRAIEVEQQQANKLAEIQEKSYEDRVKRAKEIDKELASSLADAIMGVAEHKESWGQALQKFFEQQEKKLLEKSLQKLFDQSGIGELFGGLFDLGGSNSTEDALKIATSANTQSTDKNTGVLERLITALNAQIKAPGATGTETGTGTTTGTGTGTAVDVGQPGSGKGGTVTTDQVAAVAAKYGFSAAFGNAVVDIESSHGANLGKGKYGGNILQVGEKERESLGVHGMGTPEEQLDYGFRLLAQRRKELSAQLGREATEDETYLAHNQGPGGAHALLTHPNEPAGQVIREATHGREGAANISSNFHGDPDRPAKDFTDRVFARLHRGENRFGGTAESGALASADAEHKQAATEHKQAAKELKDAAGALKNVPEGNSPYAKAVRADIDKNGPMAGPAAAATTSETDIPALADGGMVDRTGLALVHAGETVVPGEPASASALSPPASPNPPRGEASAAGPIPTDIRAIAGSVLAPTSGGGLPTTPVAPPSAGNSTAAASTPGFFGHIAEDLKDFAADPLGHVKRQLGFAPDHAAAYDALSPEEKAKQATAQIPAVNPPFGGEGMLSREHGSAVQENTKALEENTRAHTAQPETNLGPLLGQEPPAATGGTTVLTTGAGATGAMFYPNSGIPTFAEGGPVDETGLAMLHAGEYVVPADQVNAATADRPEPLKLGAGRDTAYDAALRALMQVSGASDLGEAIKSGTKVLPALQRGDTDTGVGAALSAAASGAFALGGIVAPEAKVGEEAAAAAKGIRAFHGSPHDFEAFDSSKIGTGEGAAAQGHGLYFAENEATAKSYREKLSLNRPLPNTREAADKLRSLQNAVIEHGAVQRNIEIFEAGLAHGGPPENIQPFLDTARQRLAELQPHYEEAKAAGLFGHMYEVGINAEPEHFLDWDKRLRDQPHIVEKFYGIKPGDFHPGAWMNTGEEFYQELAERFGAVNDRAYNGAAASEALRDAGIPGIRYLDQGSRGAGKGTSNYVVFDDKTIDILSKYGIAGLIGGGGAAALSGGESQAQPIPGLATGGTVTHSGVAQIHAGETIVPAQVVPIQTIQAGARQSQPGPGPVGQTTQTPWASMLGMLAALMVLPKLLGAFGGGKGQAGSDPDAVANTQATQQNTQATQQNTEAKQQGAPSSTAPVTSGEVGGTGVPGTGVDVGLLRAAASGSLGAAPASASAGGEGIPQFAKGGPVDQTGLAMLHAGEYVVPASAGGTIVSADDGDITGGSDSVEMVTNPLTGNAVPRYGSDGADWAMASLAEWKEGPSGSLAQQAWSSVKGAGSWAWSFNPFNAKQFSAQSFSSNSVLGGMSFEQAQSLTPMSAFSALDVVGGGGPGGVAKAAMASMGGGEPDASGASGGMMAWLNSLWSGSAQAAPAYAEGGVVSAARGTIVVPGEIAPVATQGAASPVLPKIPGLGKGWEMWAAILALLMLLMGKGGQKKPDQKSVGTTTPGQGQTQAQPKSTATPGSGSSTAPSSAPSGAGGSGADHGNGFPSVGDRHDDLDFSVGAPDSILIPGTDQPLSQFRGTGFPDVADRHDDAGPLDAAASDLGFGLAGPDAPMGVFGADAFCAGGIASAAGGLQVHETSLPQRIKSGVRGLAAKGKVGLFRAGRLTSSMRGAAVADGKGGQLAVVHPGELILPAPETSQVLSAMSSEGGAVVPSAAGGSVVALPEQQTVSSLGFQPITLEAANPSSNLGGLTQILALIMALQKLMGGLGGSGGNNSPTGSGGQGGGLLGGIFSLPQKLLGGFGNLFGGGTSGGGANSGVEGMVKAADQAAPALQGLTSSTTGASSGLTGFAGMLGSLLGGGGGGGGGGGLGGIFGFIPKLLGGLFALEGGGVIPSAAGGMVVGPGGGVPDGKGGRLIIAHPQEMVLPARQARGLSNLLANFEPSAPPDGGLGRILSMRMMTPTIPHFAQGAWELDRDMVGMLHQGEAVMPSSFADGMRAMGGRAATTSSPSITYGDTHVHLSAIDSRSGAQFLMAHSDTIAKSMFRAHRNNSRFTPGG